MSAAVEGLENGGGAILPFKVPEVAAISIPPPSRPPPPPPAAAAPASDAPPQLSHPSSPSPSPSPPQPSSSPPSPPSQPPPPPPTQRKQQKQQKQQRQRQPKQQKQPSSSSQSPSPPSDPQSQPKSKRAKRQNRNKPPKQPKKDMLLLDEVGDCLLGRLFSQPKPSPSSCPCCLPNLSVTDHFRSVLTPSSSASASIDNVAPKLSGTRSRSNSSSTSSRTLLETNNTTAAYRFLGAHHATAACHSSLESLKLKLERPSLGIRARPRKHPSVLTLNDFSNREAIEVLAAQYGRVSHMGMLDPSYSFFINKTRSAALSFKVQDKIAIVSGDPLCEPEHFTDLLAEFEEYRRQYHWGIAFLGASSVFVNYARERNWTTLQFGTERVLNPMTNEVLLEKCGKRILVQNKQLLNPTKGGVALGLYVPSYEEDLSLQDELVAVYDSWRLERNRTATTQAFITVYDPFSLPDLMTYIYTRGPDGAPNGFAALRKIGANQGYHIDPCIAAPGAPKGISDLLIFAAMSLLNRAGVSYLSLGFEPLHDFGEITGMSPLVERITRALYHHTFQRLPIGGKKAYHDKFKPDELQESGLYLVFPSGVPGPREMVAMTHMANIKIRRLVFADSKSSDRNPAHKKHQQQHQHQQSEDGRPAEHVDSNS